MRLIDADALIVQMEADAEHMEEPIGQMFTYAAISDIKHAPTIEPEPRWIPCSERLPDDDTLMLVNYIVNIPEAMDIWIGWHEMENVWYIDGEAHSKEYGNEVIAWMPLPTAYEEKKNE